MEIPNLSILIEEQVYGINKLKIFDYINPRAALSDTAILRGAYVSDCHVLNDNTLSGRTGFYWLKTRTSGGNVRAVDDDGSSGSFYCNEHYLGSRPTLPSSFILENAYSITIEPNGLQKALFGYYSGQSLEEEMQILLEKMYVNNTLTVLGKGCTFDSRKYDENDKDFLSEDQVYYGCQGNIYSRIRASSNYGENEFTLSNSKKYKNDDYVWTKVEPVIWVRHPEDKCFITEKIITAGARFKDKEGSYNGNFDETELKWFYDTYLSKDLVNPIVYNYLNNWSKQKQTVNNFIYKDANGKTIKKVKIKIKIRKT